MVRRNILFLFCLTFVTMQAGAQEETVNEAVALEIEQLASSGRLRIRGIEVASGELLVDVYERNRFELLWTRPGQIGELLEAIKAADADGLNPADYHIAQVQTGYRLLLTGETRAAEERAELDLLFTDSLIRLGYHERFVTARTSQCAISSRNVLPTIAQRPGAISTNHGAGRLARASRGGCAKAWRTG
jgi:murein L,D-transpeptidase YcbB/YkuD